MRDKTVAGEQFGARLRDLRHECRLTQLMVAERSEIPQTLISDIELGFKLPNLMTVIRLAIALDCKVSDLTAAFDEMDLRSFL